MISRKLIVFALLSLGLMLSEETNAQKSRKRASSTGKKTTSSTKKKSSAARSASGRGGKNAGKTTAKKKSSAARSASGKSGLRSASGTSGLKSTSSSSAGRKRASASSRSTARNIRTSRASSTTSTIPNSETQSATDATTFVENPCPIEALIKKDYDETGNEVYYKTKTQTCNIPENASESMWDFSNPAKAKEFTTKKSWITEDQAIYFSCNSGYITSGSKGKYTCSSYDEFCPLNEIIERNGSAYINPYPGDNCKAPVSATLQKLSDAENNSDIATGKAYRFDCADNYYTNTDNYIQCMPCPSETPYSIKGSNVGVSSCSATADASQCNDGQWMGLGAKECTALDKYTYTEIENPQPSGTLQTGAYKIILINAGDNQNSETAYIVVNKEEKKYSISIGEKGNKPATSKSSFLNNLRKTQEKKGGDSILAVNGEIVIDIKGNVGNNPGKFELYKATSLTN